MSEQTLAEYIGNLLRQGYTEEQIRQYLLQNNYPQSLVNSAFQSLQGPTTSMAAPQASPNPAVQQLAAYLQTYLAQGYQVEQLRPMLLQQGYAQGDVDQAIAQATGEQTVRHELHLPGATILKAAFLIILGVGLFFLLSSVFGNDGTAPPIKPPSHGEGTRLLDLQILTVETPVVEPGAKARVTFEAQNKGTSQKYDVAYTYELLDRNDEVINRESKTKSLSDSVELVAELDVPASAPEDTYRFRITATYGGLDEASTMATITVQEERPEPEPGENETAEPPPIIIISTSDDDDDVLEDALDAAERGEGRMAEQFCLGLDNQAKRDECLGAITATDRDPNHCGEIAGTDARDNCYMTFVMEEKYEYCDLITNPSYKETCEKLERLSELASGDEYKGPSINDFT